MKCFRGFSPSTTLVSLLVEYVREVGREESKST